MDISLEGVDCTGREKETKLQPEAASCLFSNRRLTYNSGQLRA